MSYFTATFVFYHSLNDFLPGTRKNKHVLYTFSGTPSIKDAIETLGIPHVEVDVILVNGLSVDFSFLLTTITQVQVYPKTPVIKADGIKHLLESHPQKPAFVLDVHLGTLARQLRMLGFDALYENGYADDQIAGIALAQNRIVLTRDIPLLKRKAVKWGYWLRSQHTEKQLTEVIRYYDLLKFIKPFSRCIACNGLITVVEKEQIMHQLQAQTKKCFQEFYQCSSCEKIYWKGSHYEKMVKRIEQL